MTSTLRADAPVFVPSALQAQALDVPGQEYWYTVEDDGEMEVSEEQLLELEAADEWVCLMAELDEMETEHMINLALSYAPAAAQVIEDEVMARRKGSARGARKQN